MRGGTTGNRRQTRRAILGALTGLAGSVALAACGGTGAVTGSVGSAATDAGSTSAAPTTAAPTTSVAATTTGTNITTSSAAVSESGSAASTTTALAAAPVTAAAAAPAAGTITINHMDWWSPNTPVLVTFFNGNKADFEAKYPKVKVNYIFAASVADVRQKWIVTAAGGSPPDSSQIDISFIRELMRSQLVEPLDAYIAKSPDMAMSNFIASGLFSNQQNGHTYGVPFDGPQILCISYNVDHFQEAGLDPSKNFTWKWTTEQFLDAANKLNRTQGGKTVRGGMQPFGIEPRAYSGWLYANGGDFYNQDATKTQIDSPQGQNALQLAQDLWLRYPFQVPGDTSASPGDHGLGGFEKEVYSMTYAAGTYAAGYISDANPKLNFRFAPPPQGPLASSPGSTAWTSAYGMPIGGKQKDAAWEWVSSVNSEPAQEKYFAQVQKRPSARKAVYQSAAWAAVVKEQPAVDGIETLVPESKQFPWINFTQVSTDTAPIWAKVQKGQITVSDALAQAAAIINTDITGH
jgi:arabinogalactan oligomer / maltooligosaccharide transport system substrate-binding protein